MVSEQGQTTKLPPTKVGTSGLRNKASYSNHIVEEGKQEARRRLRDCFDGLDSSKRSILLYESGSKLSCYKCVENGGSMIWVCHGADVRQRHHGRSSAPEKCFKCVVRTNDIFPRFSDANDDLHHTPRAMNVFPALFICCSCIHQIFS